MLHVNTSSFAPYGYILEGDFKDALLLLEEESQMPLSGNIYVREDEDLTALPSSAFVMERVFGLAPIQVGYCNGHNTKLNCMEFHTCPEVNLAATDMVLLLALPSDIVDGKLDVKKVKAFFVPKGTAIVLRSYVLHYSPCMYRGQPFRCGVYLAKGTNRPLRIKPADPSLWAENKWLLAHPESEPAQKGAYVGIVGENIEVA